MAYPVQNLVQLQCAVISPGTEKREPAREIDDTVELVAMDDEQAQSVGRLVNRFTQNLDAGTNASAIRPEEFVVIAGNETDARTVVDLAQDFLHHAAMVFVPEPATAQLPAIDDVAYEIERVAAVARQ